MVTADREAPGHSMIQQQVVAKASSSIQIGGATAALPSCCPPVKGQGGRKFRSGSRDSQDKG